MKVTTIILQVAAALAVGFLVVFGIEASGASPSPPGQDCDIKGNISIGSGERIYHMPGQRWYAETKISPEYGERWFCSEAEAQASGWRRAGD
jgi:hypothetical protein